MVRAVAVGVLLFVVAIASGMQVDGNGVDLFALIVLALLVNFTAAMWAAGVAMRLRTIQAGPAMQMPVFIILFLAPVYVPLDLLSRVGRGGRAPQPVHARWSRAGATSSPAATSMPLLVFGVAFGLGAVFLAWAVRGVRAAERAG